jgi:predicted nucleotidyltransferase
MADAPESSLVGAKEAADIIGVRPTNFVRDWASRRDFPKPVVSLPRRRLWDRDAILAYRRTPGRRRAERLHSLPISDETSRWLSTIKRRIVRRFDPTRIVLFGSQARGSAGPGSDIDLLVVVERADSRRRLEAEIYAALAGIPVGTDIVVVTEDDLKRYAGLKGTILGPALEDGRVIYAAL